jgi:hypothetical protein
MKIKNPFWKIWKQHSWYLRKIFSNCMDTLAGSQVSSSLANMSKIMVAIEGEAL